MGTIAVPARIKEKGIGLGCCCIEEATDDLKCRQLAEGNPERCDLCNFVDKKEYFFFQFITKDNNITYCAGQMGDEFVTYSALYWSDGKNYVAFQPRDLEIDEPIVIKNWIPDKFETPNSVRTSSGDAVLENNHILTSIDDKIVTASINDLKNEYLSFKPMTKRPKKPKQGMVFFNKNKKCLECYDGQTWRALW
tara:strand:- start:1553 stop:2134 length:582 start_codon:yes stop_codon:yes gene_type:complete